jgi:type IV pilus assembly protein PilB
MFEGHDQAIYELLAERRLVDAAALQAAFDGHRAAGRPLARVVLDLGLLDQPALLHAVTDHLGCDCTEELPASLPDDALALVGGGMARSYGLAPIAFDEFSVSVVAVDPFNPTWPTA